MRCLVQLLTRLEHVLVFQIVSVETTVAFDLFGSDHGTVKSRFQHDITIVFYCLGYKND